MALNSAFVVHIEKPAGTLLGEYFIKIRIWLDAHKITPINFRLLGGGPCIDLDVHFGSPEEANLFAREFGPKDQLTTVLRLILADLAASQASMTHTMSASDQSVSDMPAAIAGATRRL
jgi:hypothetical protein